MIAGKVHAPRFAFFSSSAAFRASRQHHLRASGSRMVSAEAVRHSKAEALEAAKAELYEHVHKTRCHPILIRLAWHDAGTYNKVGCAARGSSTFQKLDVIWNFSCLHGSWPCMVM